jgi:hypothetical protein
VISNLGSAVSIDETRLFATGFSQETPFESFDVRSYGHIDLMNQHQAIRTVNSTNSNHKQKATRFRLFNPHQASLLCKQTKPTTTRHQDKHIMGCRFLGEVTGHVASGSNPVRNLFTVVLPAATRICACCSPCCFPAQQIVAAPVNCIHASGSIVYAHRLTAHLASCAPAALQGATLQRCDGDVTAEAIQQMPQSSPHKDHATKLSSPCILCACCCVDASCGSDVMMMLRLMMVLLQLLLCPSTRN